jgi:Ca2+-binding EF-hand superfamily protein
MSNKTEEQHAYHLHKMRTRFRRLDVNKDGFISWEDFEFMASKLLEYSKIGEEHAESTRKAFTLVADNIGLKPGVKTPVEEAAKEASRKMLSMTPEKQLAVLHSGHNALFDAMDLNKDGHISLEEFKVYFQIIGPDISEAEVTHSFNTIDKNKNGEISREEFLTAAFDFMFGVEETEISKVFFGHLLP